MISEKSVIKLLLVDDEDDFRHAAGKILERRGFSVTEAADGEEALAYVRCECPHIIVLDLKMPGLSGIETLQKIREIDSSIPVIILTGHGDYQGALAGLRLEIVDFLQKPVDIDLLGEKIRMLLNRNSGRPLKERSVTELMMPPAAYPKLFVNDPVEEALRIFHKAYSQPEDPMSLLRQKVRSVLVYDGKDQFLGIIRFHDLLKLVVPPPLGDSPYTTYFTGMFLAQCKVIGKRNLWELMADELIHVEEDEPLTKAVHLMVRHHLVNLPVMRKGELVGILRERDIIKEIADNVGAVM
ncbi:MAG: response regulator [Planctomycetes bacterium]|nr:response regulator [Planctomycetota bacterium]